jgi:hypothetical protein
MNSFRFFCGTFVLLLALCAPSRAQAPRLDCVLSADRTTYQVGETPRLSVRIINKSARDVYLVGSLDGSDVGWHFPKWRLEVLDPAGKPLTTSRGGARCGNMNSLKTNDFVRVAPGQAFDPFGHGFFGLDGRWSLPAQHRACTKSV